MFASVITLVVLVAPSVLAVPTPQFRQAGPPAGRPGQGGNVFQGATGACDLSNFTLSDVGGLAAPSGTPSFIGVGVGTQNYTCSSAGNYTSTGAVADIFDISCLTGTPMFDSVQDLALSGVPQGAPLLGKHFFISTGTNATSPKWDFTSSQGDENAFVTAKKDNTVAAPTGSQDVAWLQLSAVDGQLASTVYRLDTREGQAPTSCTAGSADITVKYTSKYYFFGGSITPKTQ